MSTSTSPSAPRRVLLATCSSRPEAASDEGVLPKALEELGLAADWVVWDEAGSAAEEADLVVLRTTWDYTSRLEEFLRWCDSVPALANPARVVRWNTDKRYLVELTEAGVPVTPTRLVEPGETVPGSGATGGTDFPDREFVVKPTVGAGSSGARRFLPDQRERAVEHLRTLHRQGTAALVQPYQPVVDREGETAVVFFGGVYSHGFVKGPLLDPAGDGVVPELERGSFAVDPDPALRATAEDVLDATTALLGLGRRELLYARVDLVRGEDGAPMLLELELTEPRLGFDLADRDAPSRFASAVRAELARRGE